MWEAIGIAFTIVGAIVIVVCVVLYQLAKGGSSKG